MKKTIVSILLCITMVFSITAFSACDGEYREIYENKEAYAITQVDVYREADKVDKTIPIRFYADMPNVPYIGVDQFFTEFFKHDLVVKKNGDVFTYVLRNRAYMVFDTAQDTLAIYNLSEFSNADFFAVSSSKLYLAGIDSENTTMHEKLISLRNYNIDAHAGKMDAYVPLNLLASLAGGDTQYIIAYNGKSIYALDAGGQVYGEVRDYKYFGEEYFSVLGDYDTERAADLAAYNYCQLCFNFDNLRGYTSQLYVGDNNLLSLGLDGTLEKFYPNIKAALLSTDKVTYYAAYNALLFALYDGGHTASLVADGVIMDVVTPILQSDPDVLPIFTDYANKLLGMLSETYAFQGAKLEKFGVKGGNYYYYDEPSNTAYVGFDTFIIDFNAWDSYYREGMNEEDVPVDTDSYAFVRSKLYQALADGAENLVIDLSTNGGGIAAALLGIVGLLNGAKSYFPNYNVFNKCLSAEICGIDVDLDGDFDEDDVIETEKFKDLNIGILTSARSFSCGNLMPSLLSELGYKIIGERSGGGNCALRMAATADGLIYAHSGVTCLTNASGGNIDSGVPTDLTISVRDEAGNFDVSKFFDFDYIGAYLSTAYDKE